MVATGIDRVKHRWSPMLLAAALALGACGPAQTGGESTASPDAAPAQPSPSTDAESPEVEPAENSGPDYDY